MNRMLLVGTVALAAGLSIGGAAGAVAVPTPDPETVTVTKRVEVKVVPQVCLDALDAADTGFSKAADILALSIEGLDISGRLVQAALEDDYFEVSTLSDELGTVTPRMSEIHLNPEVYTGLRAECRATV